MATITITRQAAAEVCSAILQKAIIENFHQEQPRGNAEIALTAIAQATDAINRYKEGYLGTSDIVQDIAANTPEIRPGNDAANAVAWAMMACCHVLDVSQ